MADDKTPPPKAAPSLREMGLEGLRVPFEDRHISFLPKETKAQREEREKDRNAGIRCNVCGNWHHVRAVHLDYVGHAATTNRLLEVDPKWNWEPVAYNEQGQPAFTADGGLWIKLTVLNVTRLGFGHADAKASADKGAREKEVIGDAIRNAAMRFGVALDLWHKGGDLHTPPKDGDDGAGGATGAQTPAPPPKEGGEQQQRQRSPARPGVEAYPQVEFEKQLVGYRAAIEKGKKTAEALIKMIETKHMLTAAQRNTLLAIKPKT